MGVAAALLPCGCRLIDQTTFGAAPVPPAPDQISLALREAGRVPLAVVRFNGAEGAYLSALDTAVEAAQQRKPDVTFDIVTIIPPAATPQQQESMLARAQSDTAGVMERLVDDGVDPDRIHLGARTDPNVTDATVTGRELRIYVQ